MATRLVIWLLGAWLLGIFAPSLHAQPRDLHLSLSTALLQSLIVQASRHNQPFVTWASCHPTHQGDFYGHLRSGTGPVAADWQGQNEVARVQAYWELRRLRQQSLEEERARRRLTQQHLAALEEHQAASRQVMALRGEAARERARRQSPGRADFQDVNPVSGKIHWPATLEDTRFAVARGQLDALFVQRSRYEGTTTASASEIPRWTRALTDELKLVVHDMPSGDYVAAKTFLKRLEYESRFAPPAAGLAAR